MSAIHARVPMLKRAEVRAAYLEGGRRG
jgi:hypothetical protein